MPSDAARARLTGLLAALVGLAPACGESRAVVDVEPDAGGPAPPACARHWSVTDTRANPGLAVSVAGGALALALPLAADELVFVGHDRALTGDFEVAFDFDVFSPGATAAYLQSTLHIVDPTLPEVPFMGAGIGVDDGATDVRTMFVYRDTGRTRFDLVVTRAARGTFLLARAGKTITLTSTASTGEEATISSDVSAAPATVGLQFASGSDDAATGPASVRLTDFRVTGGGGAVVSDPFDCDSLL